MTNSTELETVFGPDAAQTQALHTVFARRGFRSTNDYTDIDEALAFGSEALGTELVCTEIVRACELKTQRCFFVRRNQEDRIEGFIALLYLNDAGFRALMYGEFCSQNPDLSHLASPSERAAAIYVWCLAGDGDSARRSVVRAVTEARRKAFPDIALFARPVSREGRMMTAALDAPSAGAAWLGWVPARPAAVQANALVAAE